MNARHAAVLALAGWVLLLPPLVLPDSDLHPEALDVDRKAPLSDWQQEESFEREEDCEEALKALPDEVRNQRSVIIPGNMGAAEIEQSHANLVTGALSAKCIRTDDPRLKGKVASFRSCPTKDGRTFDCRLCTLTVGSW